MTDAERYRRLAAMACRLAKSEKMKDAALRLEARAIIYSARAVLAEHGTQHGFETENATGLEE